MSDESEETMRLSLIEHAWLTGEFPYKRTWLTAAKKRSAGRCRRAYPFIYSAKAKPAMLNTATHHRSVTRARVLTAGACAPSA